MKALVWVGPREMELREASIPSPLAGEILIKVAYCGICGSELSGYLGENALRKPPLVMGHEFSGKIVALGRQVKAAHPTLEVGSNVTADPMVFDGTCEYCMEGLNHLCANRTLIGAHRPGAFAEYVAVPAQQVFLLPQDVDLRSGALSEPVACAVRIAELAPSVRGQDVAIFGAGAIGILTLQVLLHQGAARVFVSDTNTDRLRVAADLGAEPLNPRSEDVVARVLRATAGEGVPLSIDAVGKAITRAQCVAVTRRGGQVTLSGLHEESSAVPVADIIRKELTAQASFCYTPADFTEAIRLLEEGVIAPGSWVTDAPLDEGRMWFERLIEGPEGAVKVLLRP
ncbi:MAG: zinc-dependent alcohol dehydrogenase [Anaerolineae bacterium]